MIRVAVDPVRPDAGAIAVAARTLVQGGVVAVPTDTLYGLAVDPFDERAVARVFAIKRRSGDRALPLVASDLAQVQTWLGKLPPVGVALAEAFWPGPLTLVIDAPGTLAPAVAGGGGTVGVRVPAHPVTLALCAACQRPLTATSANASGHPPTADPNVVAEHLGALVDVLLDAGLCPGGLPSTIVDVRGRDVRLIREGAIPWDAVLERATPR